MRFSYRKKFASMGANYFLYELTPIYMGNKIKMTELLPFTGLLLNVKFSSIVMIKCYPCRLDINE